MFWPWLRFWLATLLLFALAAPAESGVERPLTRRDVNNSPTLVLDYQNNFVTGGCGGAITGCITTTRATAIAYAQDTSGLYTLFGVNAPRRTNRGLLSESQAVNVVWHSRDLRITQQLTVTGGAGTFTNGETVTATGGGTGTYVSTESTATLFGIANGSGTFTGTLTGGSSLATKTISSAATMWVQSNMTVAHAQTGVDGVASAASSITASAGNATVLYTSTIGSSTRMQSAFVKRITGTGTINMTMDNGSTYTPLSSANCFNPGDDSAGSINSSTWVRCQIPTQTLANPTVGFQIVTNADAFAIDMVQNESTTFWTSPVPATTANATRAADVYAASNYLLNLLGATTGTITQSISGFPLVSSTTFRMLGGNGTNASNYFSSGTLSTNIRCILSTNLLATFGSGTQSAPFVVGIAFSPSGHSCSANGGTIVGDSNAPGASTTFNVGSGNAGNTPVSFIKYTKVWPIRLSDTRLKAVAQ